MICPHCNEQSFSFFKLYWRPLGKKICSTCNASSRVKFSPLLNLLLLILFISAVSFTILAKNSWLLIPALGIYMCIEYFSRQKYERLVIR